MLTYESVKVVSEEEEVTREEIQEERDFIDACVDTKVMEMAQEWLVSKGLIADDKVTFKRFLHRMWFALYPRSVSQGFGDLNNESDLVGSDISVIKSMGKVISLIFMANMNPVGGRI